MEPDYKPLLTTLERDLKEKYRELDEAMDQKKKLDTLVSQLYVIINDISSSIETLKRVENDNRKPTFNI